MEVPATLGDMESVTRGGSLSGNPTESGWERLRLLPQLWELDLWDCMLTELPEALAGTDSVTRLALNVNPIDRGWEHLSSLRQLRVLVLYECQITELAATLVGMESVTSLSLSDNRIERGWERLRLLPQLRELDLDDCGLTEVPAVVESVTWLGLSWNTCCGCLIPAVGKAE